MSTNTIITIERQYGSGGHLIGEKLAESLGINGKSKELELYPNEKDPLPESKEN